MTLQLIQPHIQNLLILLTVGHMVGCKGWVDELVVCMVWLTIDYFFALTIEKFQTKYTFHPEGIPKKR